MSSDFIKRISPSASAFWMNAILRQIRDGFSELVTGETRCRDTDCINSKRFDQGGSLVRPTDMVEFFESVQLGLWHEKKDQDKSQYIKAAVYPLGKHVISFELLCEVTHA